VGSLTEDVDLGRSRYDVAGQVDRRQEGSAIQLG